MRPPARTGFHAYLNPYRGPPAWTGLPVVYSMASGVDRLPYILEYIYIIGPPALSGFPYTYNKASGPDRLPCLSRSF